MSGVAQGFMWYGIFLFSATVHEASHARAALHGGDPTAYFAGQVTLDPLPHIRRSPFGMIVLPILSVLIFGWPFGFASAPYDPRWAARYPKRSGAMALAGPLANLLIMFVVAAMVHAGILLGGFQSPESAQYTHIVEPREAGFWPAAGLILSMAFSLNLILFVLNLIPLPPLDGWAAIRLLVSERIGRRMQEMSVAGGLGWIGILIAWQVFPYLLSPAFAASLNLLYPGSSYH